MLVHQHVFSIIMKQLEMCYLKFMRVRFLSASHSTATEVFFLGGEAFMH